MDSFEFNKIAAGVLVALLVSMTGNLVSHHFFEPEHLDKNAYPIEGATEETASAGSSNAEEVINPIEPLLVSANPENGKAIMEKRCAQCHTFKKGEAHKIGPNLWNVAMNHMAHIADFAFSTAMKEKGGKWDAKALNEFIYKPAKYVKGTKMAFAGLKDDKERADVIAYLATLSDNPVKLTGGNT